MSGLTSTALPSIFIPESEKNEDFHKQFVQAITARSLMGGYNARRSLMNECVNFYLGLQGAEEFDFLQRAEDGEVLPAKWMDFNKIAVKIDLLIGELNQRGYKINVKASNKDAQSRRLNEKNRLLTEMRFKPIAEALEDEYGLPLQSDETFIPENSRELDIYMDKSYKEKSEIVMRGILNYLRKAHNWDYQRLALFRDILIMGAAFARNEIIDGIPSVERVDPRYMIWDTNAKDDFLSDSTYWGEVCYMSLGEVTKKYKVTKQELEESYNNYQAYLSDSTQYANFAGDYGFLPQTANMGLFKAEGGDLRVLVVKAFWQDFKTLSHKYSEDKFGGTHIKKVSEDEADKKNVKKTVIGIWRQGTLIGGKFLKEWGVMKNQDRSVDNIATTTPPYIALVPNYLNGAIVSKVQRLRPLQNLKNIIMYNIQLQIARSGGKGFFYDISQVPKGWDIHTAMKYLRTAGIAFIDSSVEGAGQYNQFKEIDMGLSSSVTQFLELANFLDREMDSVSGVNEARQGLIQGSSQAVGVTNAALLQSSLSTSMYFNLFSQMFTKVMNKQAGLAKISWAGKERFAPIIGDVGINFLEEDIKLELNDYNVFIEEVPPAISDQQMFTSLVTAGIQSGSLPFRSGMRLLMEKDIDDAMDQLDLEFKRQEQEQQEQQAALMEQEQQQAQMQQAQAQEANQIKMQIQQAKSDSDIKKILAQGRFDTQQQLMNYKQGLSMKKIDFLIQKQKAKEKSKPKSK